MFALALSLAVSSLILEMAIAKRWNWYREVASHNLIINMVGSLLLSYMIGIAFGAAGLIVMTAALVSTAMTIPCYKILNLWCAHEEVILQKKTQIQTTTRDFLRVIWYFMRIVTFPFRAVRWIIAQGNRLSSRFTN